MLKHLRIICALLLALGCCLPLAQANNKNGDVLEQDPKSSQNQSGVEVPHQYFLPPAPSFEKLDPTEFEDYRKRHYPPYGQLQVLKQVSVGTTVLQPGYYMVKLEAPPVESSSPTPPFPNGRLLIKRQGEVFVELPVAKVIRSDKSLKRNQFVARLVIEPLNPIQPEQVSLEYCAGSACYRTAPLLPGFLQ